jgi:hypothetical protein
MCLAWLSGEWHGILPDPHGARGAFVWETLAIQAGPLLGKS